MGRGVKFCLFFLASIVIFAGVSTAIDVSLCRSIAASGVYNLVKNVSSNSSCFTISASNVVLDCRGYTINYANTTIAEGVGIFAYKGVAYQFLNNITIRNCTLIKDTGSQHSGGIVLYFVSNATISDNYLYTRGYSAQGIYLQSGSNNVIKRNTVISIGPGGSNSVGLTFWNTDNCICSNNNFTNDGVYTAIAIIGSNRSSVTNNIATDSNGNGLYLMSVQNTIIGNNTLSSNTGAGMFVGNTNRYNSFTGNTIKSNSGCGVWLFSDTDSIFADNVVTSGSNVSTYLWSGVRHSLFVNNSFVGPIAVYLQGGPTSWVDSNKFIDSAFGNGTSSKAIVLNYARNNTFINSTLRTRDIWISSTEGMGNNFTTITFDEPLNGSILSFSSFIISQSAEDVIKLNHVRISSNKAYVNSSSQPRLNKSAIITLKGLTFPNPAPVMDLNDDGIFENCTAPRCNVISYNNSTGTLVFRVSSFTTYSSYNGAAQPTPLPAEEIPPEEEPISPILEATACYELNETACEQDDGTVASLECPAEKSCACVWNSTQNICALEWDFTDSETGCDYKCVIQSSEQTECSGGLKTLSLIAMTVPITFGDDCNAAIVSPEESGCRSSSKIVPCGGSDANLPFFGIWQVLSCAFSIALIYLYFKTQ